VFNLGVLYDLLLASRQVSQIPNGYAINVWQVSTILVGDYSVAFSLVPCLCCPLFNSDPYGLTYYVDRYRVSWLLVELHQVIDQAANLVLVLLHL